MNPSSSGRRLAYLSLTLATAGMSASADFFYLSNHPTQTIYKVNSSGVATVFANSGLNGPMGLAVDLVGNLYVANQFANSIVKYDTGGSPTVFASLGLNQPIGIAFDSHGNLFVASAGNDLIVKYDSNGAGTVFASTGIDNPVGIAIDGSDNVYVANYDSDSIRKITPGGLGTDLATGIAEPFGLAFREGYLYVGSASQNTIHRIDSLGNATVFANSGVANPMDLEFDASGNLYVPNLYSHTITKFTPTAVSSTFADDTALTGPAFLAFVPEPETELALATMATAGVLIHRRLRHGVRLR